MGSKHLFVPTPRPPTSCEIGRITPRAAGRRAFPDRGAGGTGDRCLTRDVRGKYGTALLSGLALVPPVINTVGKAATGKQSGAGGSSHRPRSNSQALRSDYGIVMMSGVARTPTWCTLNAALARTVFKSVGLVRWNSSAIASNPLPCSGEPSSTPRMRVCPVKVP